MSGSQRKEGRQIAVREATVREALETGASQLDSLEERVLRAVHGVGGRSDLVLQPKAHGAALESLRSMEVELYRRYRAHLDRPTPQDSETKDRIVRALRRKRQ
ncbi:MAG TPA: hypothetical protein VKY51_03275 [Fredinandcohnia sp.]|nr:hypothetical protein [Fredinandcohnia sp.]